MMIVRTTNGLTTWSLKVYNARTLIGLPLPIAAFVQNRYNVSEGDGAAVVCVELINSTPMANSLIGVFTQSESAGCELE